MDRHRGAEPIVFGIDDDPEMRAAIKLMLTAAGLRVNTFASAEDFLQFPIPRDTPKCLILDVRMNGLSGLGLQQRLSSDGASIPIIFLTGFGDVPTAVQAIRSGAVDFLEKPFHRDALMERVMRILDVDAQALSKRKQAADFQGRLPLLSRREDDVCQLLLEGRSTKHIAAALDISISTVTKHRAKVLEKLQVDGVFELISAMAWHQAHSSQCNTVASQ